MATIATSHANEATDKPLVAELDKYRLEFEAIKQDAEELLRGLTSAQFNWRQGPGRWSIGECLVHLNVTGDLYVPIIGKAISEAWAKRQFSEEQFSEEQFSEGPFRHSRFGNWFVRSTEPPPKMKAKAPKRFVPPPDQPLDRVAADFMALQQKFLDHLNKANGLNLSRVRVQSPITRLIKLSLGQAFALMTAHERRHLWQARQVQNDPRFPHA